MTDHELLQQYVAAGSQDAFAELVARHAGLVYGTCFRVLNDAHAAEDAAQATFLVLMQKAASLRSDTVLAGWLHRTAELAARDLRKVQRRRERHEQEARAMNAERAADDWQTLRPQLDAALAGLPAAQRDAVVLRYLQGQSHAAIAAALQCPAETVHTRLTRGLNTLRERLRKRGVLLSLAALIALLDGNAVAAVPATLTSSIQSVCAGKIAANAMARQTMEVVMRAYWYEQLKFAGAGVAAVVLLGIVGFSFFQPAAAPRTAVVNPPAAVAVESAPGTAAAITVGTAETKAPAAAPATVTEAPPEIVAPERVVESIYSALDWLTRIQEPDGHYDGVKFGASQNQDVAVTALATLAYIGAGQSTKHGNYKEPVTRASAWLAQNPSTEITQAALRALALVELAGLVNDAAHRDAALAAVNDLIARQEPTGEWIDRSIAAGYAHNIEPTSWAVFALASARATQLKFDHSAIDRARSTLDAQHREALAHQGGPAALLLGATVANEHAFLARKSLRELGGETAALTKDVLWKKPQVAADGLGLEVVAWYQGSLAALNTDNVKWLKWSPAMCNALINSQVTTGELSGSWNIRQASDGFKWGRIGATAMAALNLEIRQRIDALHHGSPENTKIILETTPPLKKKGDF